MRFSVSEIQLPKRGCSRFEIEDAAGWQTTDEGGIRLAVADGAAETAFSHAWAKMLVGLFVSGGAQIVSEAAYNLPRIRAQWQKFVQNSVADPQWYLVEKIREGAFAAILGVEIDGLGCYQAVSLGDALLLHIRSKQLLRVWPYAYARAMPAKPELLSSVDPLEEHLLLRSHGNLSAGDELWLVTDALAAYLLTEGVEWLSRPEVNRSQAAIEKRREESSFRDDDITLLRLEVQE